MTLTRRAMLQAGGGTFAGYALAADPVLAQAVRTDTAGIAAGEAEVKIGDYGMRVYEARPASGSGLPASASTLTIARSYSAAAASDGVEALHSLVRQVSEVETLSALKM